MAQFFRILEHEDGSWWYRRGREDLKRFWQLDDAIDYVTNVARAHRPSEVLVHRLDEPTEVITTFE